MPGAQAAIAHHFLPVDVRVERAKPDARSFAALIFQLALLLAVFRMFRLEQPVFFTLACLSFGGAAISYWLPLRWKQDFLILLSLAGAYALLPPAAATLLISVGMIPFAVVRTEIQFRWKVLVLIVLVVALLFIRASGLLTAGREFWPVFGAIFMFRIIIYLYDLKHLPGKPVLRDYLSYFFLLPNYYFLLFPAIDFQTFQKSYFKRDINRIAQQGIWWILRGTTHLLLYRLVYQLQVNFSPAKMPVPAAVAGKIVLCYLLYLRVSGQFHIVVGMLHLFGYDLPETNHRYLLADSLSEVWRRMNIYWKDFMVKVFYFPVYFKLRRKGELRAQIIATAVVFFTTWFLHVYQFLWLQNQFRVSLNDALFWMILGSLVLADMLIQHKRRKRPAAKGWLPRAGYALRIAMTFTVIAVLWSMWSADGLGEWLYFLKTGSI